MHSILAENVNSAFNGLTGIVEEYDIDPAQGVYGWRTRHLVIARKISEYKFSSVPELVQLFETIIDNLNPTVGIEMKTIREICDGEWRIGRIGDRKTRKRLHRRLIEIAPGERDEEVHQTKKGNQWYFGMKAHIGVDAESGPAHGLATTAANESDVVTAHAVLHGGEETVWGDSGYQGVGKRPENKDRGVDWETAMKPGLRRQLDESGPEVAAEKRRASVREKVEHPFLYVKRHFGYDKVRYRGLAKNTQRIALLLGFTNLLIAGGYATARRGATAPVVRATGQTKPVLARPSSTGLLQSSHLCKRVLTPRENTGVRLVIGLDQTFPRRQQDAL